MSPFDPPTDAEAPAIAWQARALPWRLEAWARTAGLAAAPIWGEVDPSVLLPEDS